MTESGGRSRTAGVAPGNPAAVQGPTTGSSAAADASRLLWCAGLAAIVLCVAAFVLWTRQGAGILLDMMLASCV